MVHGNDKAISTTACMCAVQNFKKKGKQKSERGTILNTKKKKKKKKSQGNVSQDNNLF